MDCLEGRVMTSAWTVTLFANYEAPEGSADRKEGIAAGVQWPAHGLIGYWSVSRCP